jgi:hypothetical protein
VPEIIAEIKQEMDARTKPRKPRAYSVLSDIRISREDLRARNNL